jgi:adenosylhomocysteine nucleosidase
MKRILSFVIIFTMLFTTVSLAADTPQKANGYIEAVDTYGAIARAVVDKLNGNRNGLTIIVEADGNIVAEDYFLIANNSSGEFEIGEYKVYVSTSGNTKIDYCFITYAPEPTLAPIGIISAMASELQLLLDTADISRTETIGKTTYHIGKLGGKDVILVRAGVGKALSAAYTAVLIDHYNVSDIIFTGIAGGVGDEVKVLDVVVSTDLVQHDYGAWTNDGLVWTTSGGANNRTGLIPTDDRLREIAYNAAVSVCGEESVYKGLVATGDQFIMSETYVAHLQEAFNALACEMEGAAVARVAYEFGTPCIIIRCMSDKADGLAHEVIADFGILAADKSASIVIEMMKNM